MYLHGLSAGFVGSSPSGTFQSGSQTIPNMTENSCGQQGGSWRTYNPNNMTFNSPGDCVLPVYSALPASTPPPQISVSVPTNVNTQVSPAISPAFVQQDHPTGSPVGISTSSNPAQSSAPDNSAYLKQLHDEQMAFEEQMSQEQAARDAALIAAQSQPVSLSPSPAQQSPASSQMVMIPSSPAPDPSSPAPAPVAVVSGFAQYEHYWPYALLAVVAVGAVVMVGKKSKQRRK